MSKGVSRFKNMTVPRQPGETGRFRVLGGPDTGVVFVTTMSRVMIGRGEENDIVLGDLKMSRRHIEVTFSSGAVILRDVGSAHGVSVNGVLQKQVSLRSGDKIGLGESVIEFIGAEAGANQMATAAPRRTSAVVGSGTSGLTQFVPRPSGVGSKSAVSASAAAASKNPSFLEKNKKFIMLLIALMLVAGLLPEVEHQQKKKKEKYLTTQEVEADRSLALAPPLVDEKTKAQADIHFREGFREFRARNYLRAETSFETALQIYIDHPLARIYLENTKKAKDAEAKEHFETAKKDEEANRLKQAQIHYDSVKRLFVKDQSNPSYKEADKRSDELLKRIKEAAERN